MRMVTMPKKSPSKFLILLLAVLALAACEDPSDDVTPPTILRYEFEGDRFSPGEQLQVNVHFEDDVELNQVRFRIREAFAKSFGHWALVRVESLNGRFHEGSYSFTIPDTSLAGKYEIGMQVVDLRGNASIDSLRGFFIDQEGIQPGFANVSTIPEADEDGVIILQHVDELTFSGQVIDAKGLDRIQFEYRSHTAQVLENWEYAFGDSLVLSWDFTNADTARIDEFAEKPARLTIKALNKQGHQSRMQYGFYFFP